jgi:hypothetical protein
VHGRVLAVRLSRFSPALALKDAPAWLQLPTREAQQDDLATLLPAYEAATRRVFTSDTYIVEAIHALDS